MFSANIQVVLRQCVVCVNFHSMRIIRDPRWDQHPFFCPWRVVTALGVFHNRILKRESMIAHAVKIASLRKMRAISSEKNHLGISARDTPCGQSCDFLSKLWHFPWFSMWFVCTEYVSQHEILQVARESLVKNGTIWDCISSPSIHKDFSSHKCVRTVQRKLAPPFIRAESSSVSTPLFWSTRCVRHRRRFARWVKKTWTSSSTGTSWSKPCTR